MLVFVLCFVFGKGRFVVVVSLWVLFALWVLGSFRGLWFLLVVVCMFDFAHYVLFFFGVGGGGEGMVFGCCCFLCLFFSVFFVALGFLFS